MNPQDPLGALRDIHLPQTGGFWPPAPGWWILALVLILLIGMAGWLVWRRLRKTRGLRQAKSELADLARTAERSPEWFSRLNSLLKRAARECYPDTHPEALSGEAWITFLLSKAPTDRIASRPIVEAIVHSAWLPSVTAADPHQALEFSTRWLGGQKC
jgi:ABC-type nickel/cobalt efflux system permease component RcnA